MMTQNPQAPSSPRPFFSELPAYVLTYLDEAGDRCIASESATDGRAVLCFLSPVDALIEVVQLGRIGRQFQVLPAPLVPPDAFLDRDGRGLMIDLHLGWPVANGKLLLRPGGAMARYSREMHHWSRAPLRVEFDETVLAEVARLHERAGPFAWREALDHVRNWKPDRLCRAATRALASIEMARADLFACRNVAMSDPEMEQWHVVSCADA
ncbi:hypothetical protein ACUXAV_006558 [Cupriavidus metallidurans]|jgi:hypothetical protein|uniref:hypothetical protein n=1 Tax=Cupriavidus TaxID=106589 RepID=UPI00079B8D36|nr:hypothetical protein [Cupriavidus metallidurans]KWW33344.1 hypothetical protein AU374_05324 [Cupriavidus metallidurans]MDE4922417.1 hypothetical protein [Cupriavidus metallidurans]